jgi:hypothetical protein
VSGGDAFAEEKERRYARGLTPTIAANRSRKTVAEPYPALSATASTGSVVVSSRRCASRTLALAIHAAGVTPTCSRNRRHSVRQLIAA